MTESVALAVLPSAEHAALVKRTEELSRHKRPSKATERAHAADWRSFEAWAASSNTPTFPAHPSDVARFAVHLSREGLKVSTIERMIASICSRHRAAELPVPRDQGLSNLLENLRRELGVGKTQKAPLLAEHVRLIVRGQSLKTRAILLVGFSGALRRSEISALEPRDFAFTKAGLTLTIRKSKTDQTKEGQKVAILYASDPRVCPVRTLQDYLEWYAARADADEPLFPCDRTIARVVKRAARRAGLKEDFGGHSLRAGLATSAAASGKSLDSIMKQGRWKTERHARSYIRHGSLFIDNATAGLL
jgi:integrase